MARTKYRPANILGELLKKGRLKAGLKQIDVIVLLSEKGIVFDRAVLSRIEGLQRGLNDFEAQALADIYGLEIGELFRLARSKRPD